MAVKTLGAKVDALLVAEAEGLAPLRAAARVVKFLRKEGDKDCGDVVVAAEAVGFAIEARAGTAVAEVVAKMPGVEVGDGIGGAGGGKGAGWDSVGVAANRHAREAKSEREGNKVLWVRESGVLCGEGTRPVGSAEATADIQASTRARVDRIIGDDVVEPL